MGRGSELRQQRVETATQLWQAQRVPFLFGSGRGDSSEIAQLLQQRSIPSEAIGSESCSRTTEENARFTAELLQPEGVQRIVLVTDPPHMLRSFLTVRSLGFEVIPHLTPLPARFPPQRQAFLLAREYAGLASYGLLTRTVYPSSASCPTAADD